MHDIGVLDIDQEPGGHVKLFDGLTEVASFSLGDSGNNGFANYDFGGATGDSLQVFFKSSGAVTGFSFSMAPEPTAIALCGLAVLGVLLRRRRRS